MMIIIHLPRCVSYKLGKLFITKVLVTNFWQCTRDNILMDEINVWCDLESEEKDLVCVDK